VRRHDEDDEPQNL